jgi:peptidoglycan hydrolase CwlO-like protein
MSSLRKIAALFGVSISLFFALVVSTPAIADSTSDYNQKVAAAQAKIADLQSQLDAAQANLDSWTNSSNSQADQINTAQTAVMEAQDALDAAEATYNSDKATYDSYFVEVSAAEQVVAQAISDVNTAIDLLDSTYADYTVAQQNADNAQAAMNQAKTDYDTKLINVGGQGTTPGLTVDVYTGISRNGNPPSRSDTVYTKCKTTTVSNIQANWGGGDIMGCGSEYVMLHYKGYITYPTTTKVYFQNQADDGFYMSINGTQVINDWSLKGCGANSTGMFSFTGGKSYSIDAWFYEWTGGACSTLYYQPLGGSWNVAPASLFTQNAVATLVKDPALLAILNNKTALYVQAVAVEEQANQVYLNAETNYDGKYLTYGMFSQDLSTKRGILSGYESVMNDSETNWQNRSDDNAVAAANLRDLKAEYATVFAAIQTAVAQVDSLETKLAQAKVDLANIPKPTASDKRKPKKTAAKYFADGAYLPRPTFSPLPK